MRFWIAALGRICPRGGTGLPRGNSVWGALDRPSQTGPSGCPRAELDCPWSWVTLGHPVTPCNGWSVLGAVRAYGLDGPSHPVASSRAPCSVAHSQLLTQACLVGNACRLRSPSGKELVASMPYPRRPSGHPFSTLLNHILSPPSWGARGLIGKKVHLGQS